MRSVLTRPAFLLLLLAGCSGGQEGMPADATPGKPPEQITNQMKDFATTQKAARANRPAFTPPPLGPRR
jgi:hypothetical protein